MSTEAKPGLFSEIKASDTRAFHGGTPCTVKEVLESLEKNDREDLEKALEDRSIMGTSITNVLKRRGFNISAHTVQRHRRGGCSCDRIQGV